MACASRPTVCALAAPVLVECSPGNVNSDSGGAVMRLVLAVGVVLVMAACSDSGAVDELEERVAALEAALEDATPGELTVLSKGFARNIEVEDRARLSLVGATVGVSVHDYCVSYTVAGREAEQCATVYSYSPATEDASEFAEELNALAGVRAECWQSVTVGEPLPACWAALS